MEVTGVIKLIKNTESVGSGNFQKRDIIITTDEQYPQHISIQFVQDKCDLLDSYKIGQSVEIGINLRGREWVNPQGETRYFNTIQGWRIKNTGSVADEYNSTSTPPMPPTNLTNESDDDLLF